MHFESSYISLRFENVQLTFNKFKVQKLVSTGILGSAIILKYFPNLICFFTTEDLQGLDKNSNEALKGCNNNHLKGVVTEVKKIASYLENIMPKIYRNLQVCNVYCFLT